MGKPEDLIEQGVEVLRRLSVAKVSLSDASFIAGWVSEARTALRQQALASQPITVETTPLTLDAEELDTILAIGRNEQSGRVTNYELKELVRVYRAALTPERK